MTHPTCIMSALQQHVFGVQLFLEFKMKTETTTYLAL